jgi:hypothetical protein
MFIGLITIYTAVSHPLVRSQWPRGLSHELSSPPQARVVSLNPIRSMNAFVYSVFIPQAEDNISGATLWQETSGSNTFSRGKLLGISLTKMFCLLGHKSEVSTRNDSPYTEQESNQSEPTEYSSGYGFHFQRRNAGNASTGELESFAHASWRTLVHAVCGYPKGSPDTNSYSRNSPLQLLVQPSPQCTPRLPVVNLIAQPHSRRLWRHMSNELPTRYLV